MRSKLQATLVVAAAALGASFVLPATPALAATCSGSGCTGREPNGTSCATDAYTARSISFAGRFVELRYSPSCRAAWGRISGARVGDQAYVSNTNHQSYTATVNSGSDAHTLMVNDMNIQAWACGWTVNGDNCTTNF